MRVLYVVPRFPQPSETFVSREIAALERQGMQVAIVSLASPRAAAVEKVDAGGRALAARTRYLDATDLAAAAAALPTVGWKTWGLALRLSRQSSSGANAARRLLRALAVARIARSSGVDWLHAHWPYPSEVTAIASAHSGIPYSISVHAHEVAHDNGHFPEVFQTLRFASFCNAAAMNHLLTHLPEECRERCQLIYHGVDVASFPLLPLPQDTQSFRIVSAGRLTPTKGFDRLIRACAALRARGVDARLTILGQGSAEPALRQLALDLEIADMVDLPGWVAHEEIRERYREAHLFALLADVDFHDGLPNVVLEAMASGRPVILSPLPAAGEAVSDGVEGFILQSPDDAEGFCRAAALLASEPTRLAGMGRAARRRVEHAFDDTRGAAQLQRLFSGAIGAEKEAEDRTGGPGRITRKALRRERHGHGHDWSSRYLS